MSRRYSTADLMAAIVDLRDATAHGFASVDRRFDALRAELRSEMDIRFESFEHKMSKRFDSHDLRFDALERRLQHLEAARS